MTLLLLTLSAFLLYLVYERITLDRLRRQIPLVITVTGTRGKSSVVRLLASVLREDGQKVLAKTTGSQAQYVLPDGTVSDVPRRGVVSILEQKKTLRKAAALGVDCLVVEVMSVHPENHLIESQKILKPNTVLLTNVRRDHTDAMGETEEEIARVLGLDLIPEAKVILPKQYLRLMQSSVRESDALHFHPASPDASNSLAFNGGGVGCEVLSGNVDLVAATAREMKIGDEVIARGVSRAVQDIGEFRIWKYVVGGKQLFVVNAFAANDPDSTAKLLDATRAALATTAPSLVGLLNLRRDRADRTLQWIRAFSGPFRDRFESLFVVGGHAHVLARKVACARVLTSDNPEEILRLIGSQVKDRAILFGFGNIGGLGAGMVDLWNRNGEPYGA